MKKKSFIFIVILLLVITQNFISIADQKFKTGDIIFAEWVVNGWYHGTIGDQCGSESYMILFDDGDKKCCETGQIVPDKIPLKSNVTVGIAVLAQWSNGRYYPGTVAKVSNDYYTINFDDGDTGEVRINQIRLRN